MPVERKNQIRPRRRAFRFSNAEILTLDTVNFFMLVEPSPLGTALLLHRIQMRSHVVVDYGNIDPANAYFYFFDDFTDGCYIENSDPLMTGGQQLVAVSHLFAPVGSFTLGLLSMVCPALYYPGVFNEVDIATGFAWADEADLVATGGIGFFFNNNGSDMNAGDPENYLDIFVDYAIVNLSD